MSLLLPLLSCFLLAGLIPFLTRIFQNRTGMILSAHPIISFFIFLQVAFSPEYPINIWIHYNPETWFRLSFWLDGKSLTLALLTCTVSIVVLLDNLENGSQLHEIQSRFRRVFLLMGAFFGLILLDHIASLFIFWLAINVMILLSWSRPLPFRFNRSSYKRRLFFGAAGILMLVALLILFQTAGIPEPSQWNNNTIVIVGNPSVGLAFSCILASFLITYHLFRTNYFRCRSITKPQSAQTSVFFGHPYLFGPVYSDPDLSDCLI